MPPLLTAINLVCRDERTGEQDMRKSPDLAESNSFLPSDSSTEF